MAGANTQLARRPTINAVYDDAASGPTRLDVLSGGRNRWRFSWLRALKGTATAAQKPVLNFFLKALLNAGLLLAAALLTVIIFGVIGMLHETTKTVKKKATSDISVNLLKKEELPPVREEEDPFTEEPKKLYEAKKQAPKAEKTPPKFEILAPGLGMDANLAGLAISMSQWDIPQVKFEYGIGEVDQVPIATFQIPPEYPYHAKRQGTEGVVSIRFLVTREGEVSSFSVIKATPEGVFDEAARRSVLRWQFKPGMKDDMAVDTWVEMDIEFELG
jgi:protein TonB